MVKPPSRTDNNDARARETQRKIDQPTIPREGSQETTTPNHRNIWFSTPWLLTVIGGLVTAAIGAAISGYFNNDLENRKLEASLIQKAFEATNDNDKASGLKFLAQAGLINDYKAKIEKVALQNFLGAAIRDHLITVEDVKNVLLHLRMHQGPINDEADEAFRKEIAEFQMRREIDPDGYVGAKTYAKLREAWPEYFIPNFITVRDIKIAFAKHSLHTGPINDEADDAFREEIEKFQKSQGLPKDGYIGSPDIYAKMREVWPEDFKK